MVKSYVSLGCIEDAKRLDRSLNSLLDLDIDGIHLDVLSRTPDGTATPFLPECACAIADYARSRKRYDGLKVDVHLLVPKPQLAVRNYKRKDLSGIILPGDAFENNPGRLSRSLHEIKNETPKMKSGISYSISQVDAAHAFMKDLDYALYTVDGSVDMVALDKLSELSLVKVRTNPMLYIMVEGRFSPEDVKSLCATGIDAIILKYDRLNDFKYVFEKVKKS